MASDCHVVLGDRKRLARGDAQLHLDEVEAGDFFGEITLIVNGDRVATIVAIEESRLLIIDAQDLARFLDSNPE